jgi:thioredoxin-like negative regulator of GroEL
VVPIVDGLYRQYKGRVGLKRVNILNPASKAMMERFMFSTTPEIYLVDSSGRVLAQWDELMRAEEVAAAIDAALAAIEPE